MSSTLHPGVNEIEWFADLKTVAEAVGSAVLQRPIRWNVETATGGKRRCDVKVTTAEGEVVFTGEGKRPNEPKGAHPLVSTEVDNAVGKAQTEGASWCFTTNFLQVAVLSASPGLHGQPLRRVLCDLIELVNPSHATSVGWWKNLSTTEREAIVTPGLTKLFNAIRLAELNESTPLSVDDIAIDYFSALTGTLLEPLTRSFTAVAEAPTAEITQRAMTSGLSLNDPQERRYLVAQGIAEVLTASLFHRLLRNHFRDLPPLLGGTQPSTGTLLERTVSDGLAEAVQISGDYKPILVIDGIASWALSGATPDAITHWLALFEFVERLDLAEVSSDILGTIFERLISPERRHQLGQHYTQPRLAMAMAKWGVTTAETSVLDPACGAGTFLVETYKRHAELGLRHDQILSRTFGNDVDNFAVHLASINLATRRIRQGLNHPLIREGDAFQLDANTTNMLHVAAADDAPVEDVPLPLVDLVIANPPYGRTAPNELACKARIAPALRIGDPFDSGMNFAAWFVLLASVLVKPGGRMAFVLPISVLQNENLRKWREWLRRRYDLVIWRTEADIWFSDARVATCVILFTPRPAQRSGTYGRAHFVQVNGVVDGELYDVQNLPTPSLDVDIADISYADGVDDLLVLGAMPEPLRLFDEALSTTRLKDLTGFSSNAGTKLGHKFFELRDENPDNQGQIRHVRGMGTSLRINRDFLTPLLSGPKQMDSGEPTLTNCWALTIPPTKRPAATTALGSYLRLGENAGVHTAPSVQTRKPWWALSTRTFQVAVPMSQAFRHQVAWMPEGGAITNNFNGLTMANQGDQSLQSAELVAASLASAYGALSTLHQSGELGNEGARRTLLRHFNEWPVLDPESVTPENRDSVLTAYRVYRQIRPSELDQMSTEEAAALRVLTRAVAVAAGLPASSGDDTLDLAQSRVAQRRLLETRALSGRTRGASGAGPSLRKRVNTWLSGYAPFAEIVETLLSGPRVFRLRDKESIETPTLFSDHPFEEIPDLEMDLVDLLGGHFEAAWPAASETTTLEGLTIELGQMVVQATHDLLPEDPGLGHPGRATWIAMQAELIVELRRNLQFELRKVLS